MSTTAAIHPSFWAKAATWIVNEAKTIKNVFVKIQTEMPAVDAEIKKIAPTAEAMLALVNPVAAQFMAHAIDVWSTAASAIDASDQAVIANGINIALDSAMVAKIKSFIPTVKAQMSASPTP
jgi:hypothetical protein